MDKQHALIEKFFQFLVQPQKRKWRFTEDAYFYKNLEKTMMLASALLGLVFIFSLCLILYAYQRNKEDIQQGQIAASHTIIERGNFAQAISNLSSLVRSKSKLWYRFIYGLEIADARLLTSIDKTLLSNTKQYCVPYMMALVNKQLAYNLMREDWSEVLADFHVYLMLVNKEPFQKNTVIAWFEKHKTLLSKMLPINESGTFALLQSITPLTFENVQQDAYLYDRVVAALHSSGLSQSVYSSITERLSSKPCLSVAKFASKKLLSLLNPSIDLVKVPHVFTKEGYLNFESHKKNITAALLNIGHLSQVLEIDQVKNSIEETTQIYKEAYEAEWNSMWARIRFKNSNNIQDCLANFKALAQELPSVLNFIRRIEKNILIQNAADYLSGNEMVSKGIAKLNDLGILAPDRFSSYVPMTLEAFNVSKEGMQANLAELVQCCAEVSNARNKDHFCYKMVTNVPKEESAAHKGVILAATLSSPLNVMYKELVNNFDWVIHKGSAAHINSVWHKDVYSYYMQNIHKKYPFDVNNYQDQLSIEDFATFFAAGGKLDQFQKDYLGKGKVALSLQTKNLLQHFTQIQLHWFGESQQPKIAFNITNVTIEPAIKHVDLQLLGKQVRISSNNLGPNEFIWTNKGLEMAKIEFLTNQNLTSSIVYSGPWSWYKLLELEDAKGPDVIRKTLKTGNGSIGFFIHFEPKFFPLSSNRMQIPRYIAGVNNH
jgi:type VI protein secretion system component VasK